MPISIIEEKKVIVNNILKAIVILGFALVSVTLVRDVSANVNWINMAINMFFLSIMFFLLILGKRVSYETKTWTIIIVFLFVGSKLLSVTGLAGSTFYFFLMAALVSMLILSKRKSLYVILTASLIYTVLSAFFAFGIFEPLISSTTIINNKVKWISELCSYNFLLFILIGGVGRLQNSFIKTINELDEANQKLNQHIEELRNQLEYNKEMSDKVVEKEMNFKTLFDETNDGIIVVDADGVIIEANKAICTMLDFPKSFIIGNHSSDFVIYEEKIPITQMSIDRIQRAKVRELHLVSKNKVRIPVEINYSVIQFNNERAILVTVRDIRERKQTEQKVLSAVIEAEENERSRFAKDLHDDLGPILSSIKMYIQSLRQHEDNNDKKELINRLITTVDDSIKSIRKISYNLSSHLLQNMGLIQALNTHVERINMSKAFEVTLDHNFDKEVRLPSNIEIVVYRVLLELINNSITHSQGNRIDISLLQNANGFMINYTDNGIGFDIDKILHDNSKGIGLRNILSRIKSIKGLLNFETAKDGFSLTIDITL